MEKQIKKISFKEKEGGREGKRKRGKRRKEGTEGGRIVEGIMGGMKGMREGGREERSNGRR